MRHGTFRLVPPLVVAGVLAVAAPAGAIGLILHDSGNPTAGEQRVLETINRARRDPVAEGARLGFSIHEGLPGGQKAVPRPPLAMNRDLLAAARAHSEDMYARRYFAHTDPDGDDPFERMTAAGYTGGSLGENIAGGGAHSPGALEDLLMRDLDYPQRGHRVNLLDVGATSVYREIGIGYAQGLAVITGSQSANGLKDFLTEDFGRSGDGPFLLGVVYADGNGNGSYDAGEGLPGVAIMPDTGTHFAVTGTAGGYAFPVAASGSIDVTASGGALGQAVRARVVLTGENAKLDFFPGGSAGGVSVSASLADADGDGFPDELETAAGTSPADGGDTPFGGSAAAPLPLRVPSLAIRLDFAQASKDRIALTCKVPVPEGFDPEGRTLLVDVGGVVRTFVLDAKGRGVGAADATARLALKSARGVVKAQNATLTVRISESSVAAALADEGLADATTRGPARVTVPAIVALDPTYLTLEKRLRWRARHGKSGSAK